MKRLVARPDSRVELQNGNLFVDGHFIPEPYVARLEQDSSGTWNTGNGYFLLGDNRQESHDSRAWGALPPEQLEARLWIK